MKAASDSAYGSYPVSCSRQVPNMFKLTKIWSPITSGMPNYTYEPSLRLLAQYSSLLKWRAVQCSTVTVQCNKNWNYVKYLTTEREKIVGEFNIAVINRMQNCLFHNIFLSFNTFNVFCVIIQKKGRKGHFLLSNNIQGICQFLKKIGNFQKC